MLQTALYTDIGGRSCNEDCVRRCTGNGESLCLVLADGLGGHGGGSYASDAVVKQYPKGLQAVSPLLSSQIFFRRHTEM